MQQAYASSKAYAPSKTYVWVYRTSTHMLMVKRAPWAHRSETSDPSTGLLYVNIVPGTRVLLPKWDWVSYGRGQTIAGFGSNVYDISDLM